MNDFVKRQDSEVQLGPGYSSAATDDTMLITWEDQEERRPMYSPRRPPQQEEVTEEMEEIFADWSQWVERTQGHRPGLTDQMTSTPKARAVERGDADSRAIREDLRRSGYGDDRSDHGWSSAATRTSTHPGPERTIYGEERKTFDLRPGDARVEQPPPLPPKMRRPVKGEGRQAYHPGPTYYDAAAAEVGQSVAEPARIHPSDSERPPSPQETSDMKAWRDLNAALDEVEFNEAMVPGRWEAQQRYPVQPLRPEWKGVSAEPSWPVRLDSVPDPMGGYRPPLPAGIRDVKPVKGVRRQELDGAESKSCDFRAAGTESQVFTEQGRVRQEVFPGHVYVNIEPIREQKRSLEPITEMQAWESDVRTHPPHANCPEVRKARPPCLQHPKRGGKQKHCPILWRTPSHGRMATTPFVGRL